MKTNPDQVTMEAMYAINSVAGDFFRRNLATAGPDSIPVRYLAGRMVSPATIERFGIGFAPDSRTALTRQLQRMNLPLGPARELGLLVAGDSGQFNDRFRDRITLPIMDLQGCPIGFAARALGNDKPAYLHSSKSPLFNLATDFYALELAYDAIRTSGTVLVVEGYFDVIRLHQGGFENAVAVLGTAVTEHHVRRLSGLAKRIVLVFGGDPTGRQAAGRVVELFRECELEPNVAFLGGDTDAETFLERWGASELRARIDSAVPCRR